jgi:hypothetical protein
MERPKVWSILSHGISLNTSYRFRSSSSSTLAAALPLAGRRLLSPPYHGYSSYASILLPQPRRPLHRVFVRRSAWRRPLHGSSSCRPRRPYGASSYGAPSRATPYVALPHAGYTAPNADPTHAGRVVPYGASSYGAPPGAAAAVHHTGYAAPTRLFSTPATLPATRLLPTPATPPPTRLLPTLAVPPPTALLLAPPR